MDNSSTNIYNSSQVFSHTHADTRFHEGQLTFQLSNSSGLLILLQQLFLMYWGIKIITIKPCHYRAC